MDYNIVVRELRIRYKRNDNNIIYRESRSCITLSQFQMWVQAWLSGMFIYVISHCWWCLHIDIYWAVAGGLTHNAIIWRRLVAFVWSHLLTRISIAFLKWSAADTHSTWKFVYITTEYILNVQYNIINLKKNAFVDE